MTIWSYYFQVLGLIIISYLFESKVLGAGHKANLFSDMTYLFTLDKPCSKKSKIRHISEIRHM